LWSLLEITRCIIKAEGEFMLYSQDKKAQILESADSLFHRFGYAKTSLDDIAKEAGMGKGTIYYYFESKEEIFLSVVNQYAERYEKVMKDSVEAATDFIEKFTIFISLPVKLVYKHAPLADALKNLPENYLQKLQDFRQEHKQNMINLLDQIIKEGLERGAITEVIPPEKIVSIIFDWILMGDTNIIIHNPDAFIAKAEAEYKWLINMILYGILKRGETE
jgi:AcrR family transcriptional regulator